MKQRTETVSGKNRTMKTQLPLATVAMSAILLTACGTGTGQVAETVTTSAAPTTTTAATPTTTTSATTEASSAQDRQADECATLASEHPDVTTRPEFTMTLTQQDGLPSGAIGDAETATGAPIMCYIPLGGDASIAVGDDEVSALQSDILFGNV